MKSWQKLIRSKPQSSDQLDDLMTLLLYLSVQSMSIYY